MNVFVIDLIISRLILSKHSSIDLILSMYQQYLKTGGECHPSFSEKYSDLKVVRGVIVSATAPVYPLNH